MARVAINAGDEWVRDLVKLGNQADAVAARALAKGAGVVADKIRANLEALAEDFNPDEGKRPYHYLPEGAHFSGIPDYQKKDLLDSLGISPVQADAEGNYNVKIGFDGYGSQPTEKYPKGLPNPLAARAVESGTSIRPRQPFVKPAVNKSKKAAIEAMQEVVQAAVAETMKR